MHFQTPVDRGLTKESQQSCPSHEHWSRPVDRSSPLSPSLSSLSPVVPASISFFPHAGGGYAAPLASVRKGVRVLGPRIDAVDWDEALERIGRWAERREARYVVACNVHSVVTAGQDAALLAAINGADLATADGAPVAWLMRKLGCLRQERIDGPDLMWRYLARAANRGESVFFYGSTPETLARLVARVEAAFPGLRVAGSYSPPFRDLTPAEDEAVVQRINESGAQTVWVALGCPKQEVWMAAHRRSIRAVQIGVGAAFSFHAGTTRRAPQWMQRSGLEWMHRLLSEPRRLARRYAVTNTRFVIGAASTLIGMR